ncbi:hypothetical protein BDZ89DRAFT_1151999 [Hymenopellis radicata]|nr:hypothetical protein BDZ89DRAFT_1151999 [Hymenopellis radicata]
MERSTRPGRKAVPYAGLERDESVDRSDNDGDYVPSPSLEDDEHMDVDRGEGEMEGEGGGVDDEVDDEEAQLQAMLAEIRRKKAAKAKSQPKPATVKANKIDLLDQRPACPTSSASNHANGPSTRCRG